jgi:hypothetical protein
LCWKRLWRVITCLVYYNTSIYLLKELCVYLNEQSNRFFHTLIWKTGGSSTSDRNFMFFHEWSAAQRVERHKNISITSGRSGDVPYQHIKVPISSVNNIIFHIRTPMYGFHWSIPHLHIRYYCALRHSTWLRNVGHRVYYVALR